VLFFRRTLLANGGVAVCLAISISFSSTALAAPQEHQPLRPLPERPPGVLTPAPTAEAAGPELPDPPDPGAEVWSLGDAKPGARVGYDVMVICPDALVPALEPWILWRQQQGHRILVEKPAETAYEIRRQVRAAAQSNPLTHIVLAGDTPGSQGTRGNLAVPTDYIAAEVVSQFGSEPEIATDSTYADLDSDGVPDLAIGRLPVDSPEQLQQLVRKIIDYERAPVGDWQRRINVVAGTSGFGAIPDSVIEKASRGMLSELIPPAYTISMTWANWSSVYCPDPRAFADTTVERLNEGCLFWVYMGHGQPHRLDYVRTPAGGYPMFTQQDVQRLNCQDGKPVAMILACYTGAYDLPADCLAEDLVLQPGGPVAAVSSSRLSMPYGISALSLGLIEEYFGGRQATLGEMLLVAKRQLVNNGPVAASQPDPAPRVMAVQSDEPEDPHDKYRHTIRLLGQSFSPVGELLDQEAMEHVHLFHLLGDPLLRIQRPEPLELVAWRDPAEPDRLVVQGNAPEEGDLLLELGLARDRLPTRPPPRFEFRADDRFLDSYEPIYRQANTKTVSHRKVRVEAGTFMTELDIPPETTGRCVVQGFITAGPYRFALGASRIQLQRR
jgi:hypothetical protein